MYTSNVSFPEDILIEILSSLPVKSLIRYMCVCKFWYNLVKNDNFICKHLKNDNVDNTRLVVFHCDSTNKRSLSLFRDDTLADVSYQDFDPQMSNPEFVIGYHDGLFCLYKNYGVTLWNPATREFKTLPKSGTYVPRNIHLILPFVGFGFNPVNNDFKLVLMRVLCDEKNEILSNASHVAVYTLSTNNWREFETDDLGKYYVEPYSNFTYLNEFCYWIAYRDDYNVILSFHMSGDVFQEIQTPRLDSSYCILASDNDSLSLLRLDEIECCLEVWVMNENCWNQKLTVGPFVGVRQPLEFWKNGGFILESKNGRLLLYDPIIQEIRDLGLIANLFAVYQYKESLIMINGENNLPDVFDIPWHILGVYQTDCP